MKQIEFSEILRIAKEHAEKKYGKDWEDFTDSEEDYHIAYSTGLLKGFKLSGVEVLGIDY